MNLSLMISLDPLADSFVDALSSLPERLALRSEKADSLLFRIASSQWKAEGAANIQTSLDALGEMVLDRLAGRAVDSVDMGFFLSGNDPAATNVFLPLYRYFERFLKVLTTRRLYVIYPRRAGLLAQFGDHLAEILANAASAKHELTEVSFLVEPASPACWPQGQVRAIAMCNATAASRGKLDEVLTGAVRPCCNSSYAACVYDFHAFRDYHLLRSIHDLTVRNPVSRNTALETRAGEFIERTRLIQDESRVRYSPVEIGVFATAESLARVSASKPLETYYANSASRHKDLCGQIAHSEHAALDDLVKNYRQELVQVLDQDLTSLDSFEQALCLHHTIQELLDLPSRHREFFLKIVEPALAGIADELIGFADALAGGQSAPHRSVTGVDLGAKLASLPALLGSFSWSEISLCIRPAAVRLVSYLSAVFQISASVARGEKPPDPEVSSAVAKPFAVLLGDHLIAGSTEEELRTAARSLDGILDQLRRDHAARHRDLRQVNAEYGLLQRILHYRTYQSSRRPILEDLRRLERRYQEWRVVASALCRLVGRFLLLQSHVALVRQLFIERKRRVETTGQFLVDFADALTAKHEEAAKALGSIPAGPEVHNEVELSFLARPQMESLYQRFGPARVDQYIAHLLHDTEDSWGVWAVSRLGTYLEQLSDYSAQCFNQTPKLSLPQLMFEYFPEQRLPQIKRVVDLAASRLMPLTGDHLHDRTFHMLFGFPQGHLEQLSNDESDYAIENRQVSLKPTRVDYVDNADSVSMDLTVSVCGFRLEDYLYWGVFGEATE